MSGNSSPIQVALFALLGLGRAGKILYGTLAGLAIPALAVWFVFLPRWKFSDQDEQLFRAARHGDAAGVLSSLAAGARVDAVSPVDRKTALFRAAIFGHAPAVKALLEHGADASAVGSDGQTALQVALKARDGEEDPASARDLDEVIALLRARESQR